MFSWKKMFFLMMLLICFGSVQLGKACFAQDDSDDYKEEALVEEKIENQKLKKLKQENPLNLTDEQMEKRQEDLEGDEENLQENLDKESAKSEADVEGMLGVDTDDAGAPRVRRDLHEEEEKNIEDEAPTQNSAFGRK